MFFSGRNPRGKCCFANLPTRLGAFLKEHFPPFYEQFGVFEDEEEEEEDDNSIHSQDGEEIHHSETESEGEEGGRKQGIEEIQVEQEERTILKMKFCSEVVDDPDLDIETAVENDSAGPAEGRPRSFKSTSMDVMSPPLGTVPEEEEASLDGEAVAFLNMLEDKDMECLFGDA